ncbi:caspase family protein [Lewinella sp. W8]|uniref:caspase family protein n=1 Tax=Lewinella sp. W8 TaxID=2528208 RepID=UPI001068C022|nr:caspase family protein [Lewinella sp. W8]MTB52822.1 PQQ-binding-like beta-propeller repeat protein [Lewinella sp. W8]
MTRSLLLLCLLFMGFTLPAQSPELVIPGNPPYQIRDVEVSPDGQLVVSSSGAQVRFWDYASGKLLRTLRIPNGSVFTDNINHLAFSNDGQYLAAVSENTFSLLSVADMAVVDQREIYPAKLDRTRFLGDVTAHPSRNEFYFFLAGGKECQIAMYKIGERALFTNTKYTYPGEEPSPAKRLSFTPDGRQLLVTYLARREASIVDIYAATASALPGGQAILPDGNFLYEDRQDGAITLTVAKTDGQLVWRKRITHPDIKKLGKLYQNFVADAGQETFYYGLEGEGMISGNYRTGAGVAYVTKPGGSSNSVLQLYRSGKLLVTNRDPNRIAEARNGQVFRHFGAPLLSVSDLRTTPDGLQFAMGSRSGEIRHVRLTDRGPRQAIISPVGKSEHLAISRGGRYVASSHPDGRVSWSDAQTGSTVMVTLAYPEPRAVGLDEQGNMLVASPGGVAYYPAGSTRASWTVKGNDYPKAFAEHWFVAFSPDGRQVLSNDFVEVDNPGQATVLTAYDTRQGKVQWRSRIPCGTFQYRPDGKTVIGGSFLKDVVTINARDGKVIRTYTRRDGTHFEAAFNAAGDKLTGQERPTEGSTDETITVVGAASGQIEQRLAGHQGTVNATGFLDGDFLLSAGFDNTVRLWDLRSGREAAKLFFFDDRGDWVIITPDGRFDATPEAMKYMYYTLGKEILPLEQLYAGFFTPGLLGAVLSRSEGPVRPLSIGQVENPPSVSIRYSSGTRNLIVEDDQTEEITKVLAQAQDAVLTLSAVGNGGGVADLRLYHNGKLVGSGARNLIVESDSEADLERDYRLQLLAGENHFRAVAINGQGTESAPAELIVSFQPPKPAAGPAAEDVITLHLLTVGINQYKNPRYNLNYAEADAAGLEAALLSGMGGIVGQTKVYSVRNQAAKREDILTALQQVTAAAKPQDVFVFYYAGHGTMSEGAEPDFFLVPHDVTQIYGNETGLAQRGISATELRTLAAAIPAQKQLYILDACQSAGLASSFARRGAAEERAIAQLARSTGTHWLTASGSTQFASEFDELGHGAFTFVLLQGLSGKAAGSDRRVSVNELKAYLDAEVPELTQRTNGVPQYPASFGFGQDFPLSVH